MHPVVVAALISDLFDSLQAFQANDSHALYVASRIIARCGEFLNYDPRVAVFFTATLASLSCLDDGSLDRGTHIQDRY